MTPSTRFTALALSGLLAAAPVFVTPGLADTKPATTATQKADSGSTTTPAQKMQEAGKTPASATAGSGTPDTKTNQSKKDYAKLENQVVKTAKDASAALRDVQMARLAIFDGAPKKAVKYVGEAQASLKKADALAQDYAIKPAKAAAKDEVYLPVDSNIFLAEGFKPTKENQPAVDKANKHLAQGNSKASVEDLKLANIDVTVSVAMMPQKVATNNVNQAAAFLKQGKYYEANGALRAVDNSIVVESYSSKSLPKQGKAAK